MKTFIVLTFGFLGFAFYEMSGGSDFAPASERMASAKPDAEVVQMAQADTTEAQPATFSDQNSASITKIDTTPVVTRASLNLTDVTDTSADVAETADLPQARIIDSAETPQIILPSLIATTDTGGVITDGDVRKVSGNRVNVRGGPSTNYGIVSKLTRGEQVRILEDNGNGWVRMQPVDGGKTGWMADFLLTSG